MSGPRAISGFGILLCLWGSVPGISWAQTAPVIQSISPDAVPEGSPSTTINLKGSGFNSSSVARLTSGFQSLPTTFIDSETLQTVIPASSLSSPGSVFLDVYNADTRISSQRQLGFIVYSTSPPVVTSIDVFGAGRGSTFTMQINGSYLALATFSFGGSGIAAVSATANDTGVQVQIAVAGDAPPGPQTMTITTRVGSTSTCGQKPCSLSVVSDTGSWSATGPFHDMRAKVAAVRLLDGRVLVAGGGTNDERSATASAEIFDPNTGEWTPTNPMTVPRLAAAATLLADGRVLVAGGTDGSQFLSSVEIFDPATQSWSAAGSMIGNYPPRALLLPDGRVMLLHPVDPNGFSPGELFDPVRRTSLILPPISAVRFQAGSRTTLLTDGRVLLFHGAPSRPTIYDPNTNTYTSAGDFCGGDTQWLRLLPDAQVLCRDSFSIGLQRIPRYRAFIYDPNRLSALRATPIAPNVDVLLPNGLVMIAGATNTPFPGVGPDILYDPASDQMMPTAPFGAFLFPESIISIMLLEDGRALAIATGNSGAAVFTPPATNNPMPSIVSVKGSSSLWNPDLTTVDVQGTGFLPNSRVESGSNRLVTLYLGSRHLVALVPPALRSTVASVAVVNPAPGGGTTDPALIGSSSAPMTAPQPISDVETGNIRSGYVVITPDAGSTFPQATLTYGMVSNAIVQSQAAILPTGPTTETTMLADVVPGIGRNLGVAIANVSGTAASISLTLRTEDGTAVGAPVSLTIPNRQQIAKFVTELFPSSSIGGAFRGTLTIQSPMPVSIVGLRFSGVEFSTLPISSTGAGAASNTIVFPQFAMSGGWATTLGLVNTSTVAITGHVDIFDQAGNPMQVRLNGALQSTFNYALSPRGSVILAPRDSNGQSPF